LERTGLFCLIEGSSKQTLKVIEIALDRRSDLWLGNRGLGREAPHAAAFEPVSRSSQKKRNTF
jgi:hypothetical protein